MQKDRDHIGKLLYTARETTKFMLDDVGVLFPFALSMDQTDDVKLYFPRDELPDADWNELVDAAEANLRQQLQQGDLKAVALVSPLENDGRSGAGIQVEQPGVAIMFIYPYDQQGAHFVMGEPMTTDSLLVPSFFAPPH